MYEIKSYVVKTENMFINVLGHRTSKDNRFWEMLNVYKLVKMSFLYMSNIFQKTISLEIKYKQCKKSALRWK